MRKILATAGIVFMLGVPGVASAQVYSVEDSPITADELNSLIQNPSLDGLSRGGASGGSTSSGNQGLGSGSTIIVPQDDRTMGDRLTDLGTQWDTSSDAGDPLIKRDKSQDKGNFLKDHHLNEDAMMKGYQGAAPLVALTSKIVGYLIGLLVVSLALFNALGLFYVAVPIGFLRTLMSGGQYGNTQAGSGGMSMGMMGRMSGPGQMAQGSGMKNWRMVPASAIQAVDLAESASPGGAAGMMPGMAFGGQAQGASAEPVRPVPYYLKAQAVDMVLIGVAVVLLVLSSVLFNTGIDLGNAAASAIQWMVEKVIG